MKDKSDLDSAVTRDHPLLHGFAGGNAGGTNQGRVDVPIRGPGELSGGAPGVMKGKAVIGHGFPVKLAEEQDQLEGGFRAQAANGKGPGNAA